MQSDRIWDYYNQYEESERVRSMSVGEMLAEFHTKFKSPRNLRFGYDNAVETLAMDLITEEYKEFMKEEDAELTLGELADLVYVAYGYADRWGWNLDEAVRRKHIANLSKLGEDGEPIFREDGKVLKGPNFKPADLSDLV